MLWSSDVKKILLNLLYAGQQDIEKHDARRQLSVNSTTGLISFVLLVFFGARDFYSGNTFLAVLVLGCAVVSGASHLYLRWSGNYRVTSLFTVSICTLLSIILLLTGGEEGTGPLWLYGLPSFIFFTLELKRGRVVLVAVLILTSCILFVPNIPLAQMQYPLSFSLRFFLSFLAVSFIAYLYEYMRVVGQKELLSLSAEFDLLARRDALTGIANRRDMLEKLQQEAGAFSRGGHPFSVLLIDIDNFKRLNDTFGHNAGDHVLVELSKIFSQTVQRDGVVARWGGEEFLVLLPKMVLQDAVKIAERLRGMVEKSRYVYQRKILQVTISVGVSQYQKGENIETALLSKADKMLYVAKNSGRNRVIV